MIYSSKRKIYGFILTCFFTLCTVLSSCGCADTDLGEAILDQGYIVHSKMSCISTGDDSEDLEGASNITVVRMADSLPEDFVPSDENTVSAEESKYPIYIFFERKEDAGIMYFYTKGDKVVMNPDSSRLFFGFVNLVDISGLSDWDSSQVTNMYAMFAGTKNLPDALALKNWNTSNVTNMGFMFSGDSSMKYIDVSNWDTSKVTSMAAMFQVGKSFQGDGQLCEILGLGNLDVSNVKDMTCMFYGAGKMIQYDIAEWDVSNVESMNHMFCDNRSLRSLDLSRWDVSSIKTIHCMFDDNHKLKTIGDVSHWNTVNLIDAGGWLNHTESFVGNDYGELDLSGWDTTKLKAVGEMFSYTNIRTIDLSGWTFASITNDSWEGVGKGIYYEYGNGYTPLKGFGQMFMNTTNLNSVYLSETGLDTYNTAVENGVNTQDMWTNSKCACFTVK